MPAIEREETSGLSLRLNRIPYALLSPRVRSAPEAVAKLDREIVDSFS